jgi:hypothetical protein
MMAESNDWAPHIRALIYPIQFEADPIQGVDRVLEVVVQRRALGASPARYLASVRAALASDICLSELIPQNHSEGEIRRFLAEVERRLAAMIDE